MKRLIIIFVLFTFPIFSIGQTQTENYIKTTTYRVAVDPGQEDAANPSNKIEQVAYFDGLGRPKQTISVRAGGQMQNIIQYYEYDALGRSPRQYLPLSTSNGAGVDPLGIIPSPNLKTAIENFYNTSKYEHTLNPYSEMVYESTPLSRVLEQGAPGNSWVVDAQSESDHTIKFEYQTNGDIEVRLFDVTFLGDNPAAPRLEYDGYYASGELFENIAKDENWKPGSGNNNTTQEFTNKEGQVVLKRTFDGNVAHDTYYIYDDFGNLTYVLSPEASIQIISGNSLVANYQEVLDNLGYQYKYDYRNRLIEKKVPGKGWEYVVYNLLDQPVLTQDALQRTRNEWSFVKYDALSRAVYTGFITNGGSRQGLQNAANDTVSYPSVFEHPLDSPNIVVGTPIYYTSQSFPTGTVSKVLTVNYYDNYVDAAGMTVPPTVYDFHTTNDLQGLSTVSKIRVLGTADWITTIIGYDEKARPVYIQSQNTYLHTDDTKQRLLDFTGNVLESTTTHQKDGHDAIVTIDYYTYDHQNRLLSHKQQVNDESMQLIAKNTYDELGQLESKKVGGITTYDGYDDVINIHVTPDGTMSKNIPSGWGSLKTHGVVEGDGGITFKVVNNFPNRYRVGLADASSANTNVQYFSYGIYIDKDSNQNGTSYEVRLVGTGVEGSPLYENYYAEGDVFKIERVGDIIYFKKNGQTFHTETVAPEVDFIGKVLLQTSVATAGEVALFGEHVDQSLQKVDYKYNIRGWLTDINDIDQNPLIKNVDNDLFNFRINYDGEVIGDAGLPGRAKPLYNGNISQTTWRTANTDSDKHTYGYQYDALNRFKRAFSRKGNTLDDYDHFNVHNLSYDQNGNILSLTRQGENENHNALNMDDLIYSYDGNQLLGVADNSNSPIAGEGFYDGNTSGDDYTYDVNGNMVEDKNKGINSIAYNHLNLPVTVSINGIDGQGDVQNGTITYIYDATGVKLQKQVINSAGLTATTSYAGGYIYQQPNENATEQLKMFAHPEGYIEPVIAETRSKLQKSSDPTISGFNYAFNYTDIWGNIRLSYADIDGDGHIKLSTENLSEKSYYPFGLQRKYLPNNVVSSNANTVAEKIKTYQGQELTDDFGQNFHEWKYRISDPSIGRFWQVDPLAEDYIYNSTYAFQENKLGMGTELEGLELNPFYDRDHGVDYGKALIRGGGNYNNDPNRKSSAKPSIVLGMGIKA